MIGVLASERVICAALKRLGQHRKATSVKKVEGVGSRTPGGSAYHTYIVLFFVTSRGTGHRLSLGGRSHFGRARQNADVLARWQGVHCVGHEMLDNSSRRGGTFFDSRRRVRRSE